MYSINFGNLNFSFLNLIVFPPKKNGIGRVNFAFDRAVLSVSAENRHSSVIFTTIYFVRFISIPYFNMYMYISLLLLFSFAECAFKKSIEINLIVK